MSKRGKVIECERDTWIEDECVCYLRGGKCRKGRARHRDTGELVAFRAGLPDTYFSVPCRGGGYVYSEDEVLMYAPPPVRAGLDLVLELGQEDGP